MPTIHRLPNCKIVLYANDHAPPHAHLLLNDGREALVLIATGTVISSTVRTSEIAAALTWIITNRATLTHRFGELNP